MQLPWWLAPAMCLVACGSNDRNAAVIGGPVPAQLADSLQQIAARSWDPLSPLALTFDSEFMLLFRQADRLRDPIQQSIFDPLKSPAVRTVAVHVAYGLSEANYDEILRRTCLDARAGVAEPWLVNLVCFPEPTWTTVVERRFAVKSVADYLGEIATLMPTASRSVAHTLSGDRWRWTRDGMDDGSIVPVK